MAARWGGRLLAIGVEIKLSYWQFGVDQGVKASLDGESELYFGVPYTSEIEHGPLREEAMESHI